MKCSLGISNFLEEISSLSHSVVFLYFLAFTSRWVGAHVRSGYAENQRIRAPSLSAAPPAFHNRPASSDIRLPKLSCFLRGVKVERINRSEEHTSELQSPLN